ncbi:DELTA-actitoxin-Afr1a-like [Montipora foliosa]|uniref:DELTA-actitoxin-Afr1a-like n=1 Tax=Montipora foliosa TaxID=591990 RepID=UPI0035F20FB3
MDRLSFVFSLLLIVSVTATLGSVIKAKNAKGEELEAFSKRSHDAEAELKGEMSSRDEDSEMSKLVGVPRGLHERSVYITIENHSGYRWKHPSIDFQSGTNDNDLPSNIRKGEDMRNFEVRNDDGATTGTSGVFAYRIPRLDKALAVMWMSVPGEGYAWNVKLYDGRKTADSTMYHELHEHPFGPDVKGTKNLGSGLNCEGFMTSSFRATLVITVANGRY